MIWILYSAQAWPLPWGTSTRISGYTISKRCSSIFYSHIKTYTRTANRRPPRTYIYISTTRGSDFRKCNYSINATYIYALFASFCIAQHGHGRTFRRTKALGRSYLGYQGNNHRVRSHLEQLQRVHRAVIPTGSPGPRSMQIPEILVSHVTICTSQPLALITII